LKKTGGVFLVLLLLSSTYAAKPIFKDVPADHWANPAIKNVLQLGITKGYSDGTFKGENLVNRYELMVFLSNLSISLEKIMDEKLEQISLGEGSGSRVQYRVIEELKLEIEKLKEQLLAVKGNDSTYSYKTTKSSGWKIASSFTSQYYGYTAVANDPALDQKILNKTNYSRITLTANKQLEDSLIKIDIDTGWQTWESDILNDLDSGVFAAKYTSHKKVADNIDLNLFLSTGPGDYLLADRTVVSRFNDAVGFNLELWDFDYLTAFEKRSSTIERTKHVVGYTLDNLGIFSNSRIYFGYDRYYEIVSPNRLNTRSTIGSNIFITDQYQLNAKAITGFYPVTGWTTRYIEARFNAFDIIKNKLNISLMHSIMGDGFDSNAVFHEEIESVNFSGFRVGNYFMGYQGQDLMPTADIKIETGIKLWGDFNNNIGGELSSISGIGMGDPDDDLKKDSSYSYTLSQVGLYYGLNSYFKIKLVYAHNILKEKDINKDIINEKTTKVIFTGRF